MDRIIKFVGMFLWTLVFIMAAFSYKAVNDSGKLRLKDLCIEDNYNPQHLLDSELGRLLKDLNELRLSSKETKSNNLKWIDSCVGWVMVEMKSRSFEKKFEKQPPQDIGKR